MDRCFEVFYPYPFLHRLIAEEVKLRFLIYTWFKYPFYGFYDLLGKRIRFLGVSIFSIYGYNSRSSIYPRRGLHKGFFIKPHLNPKLVIKKRKLSSGIDSHTMDVMDLESRILNDGGRPIERAHVAIKIDDTIDNFERIGEISIMRDEEIDTHIASLISENNVVIVKPLDKLQGYSLELDKEYRVTIRVTGDFNGVKWWFIMKPKSNGKFEYSNLDEIY